MPSPAVQTPLEVLQQQSCLRVLSPSDLEELVAESAWRTYDKGDMVYRHGDPADLLWVVTQGWLRLYRTNREGVDRVLGYRGPGALVGEDGLLNPPLHDHSASTQEEATCLVLGRYAVRHMLQRYPALSAELLRQLVVERGRLQQDLVDVSITDTRHKLICTLLSLGERHGTVDAKGTCHVQVPMTQQELANLVRAARETVSRLCASIANVHIDSSSLRIEQWSDFKAANG